MNKHCIIATIGASSLHRQWLKKENTVDLHLIVYDDLANNREDIKKNMLSTFYSLRFK